MRIPLDRTGGAPLYAQIRDFLRASIVAGKLPAETRLPSSRELARDLGVSRITVENAYADLESEGYSEGRHGSGTYVTPPAMAIGAAMRRSGERSRRSSLDRGSRPTRTTCSSPPARSRGWR